jgi:hypothetical protein
LLNKYQGVLFRGERKLQGSSLVRWIDRKNTARTRLFHLLLDFLEPRRYAFEGFQDLRVEVARLRPTGSLQMYPAGCSVVKGRLVHAEISWRVILVSDIQYAALKRNQFAVQ